jgi:peptidoglycan/xylan/chitin deacetylase (PgdA/CDA1 family)
MTNFSNLLQESITNRGILETAKRGLSIVERYGLVQKKLHTNMKFLSKTLEEYNINATISIPSSILSHNTEILSIIDVDRIELAVHGCHHVDYTKLSAEVVASHLRRAIQIFEENEIEAYGFRAPYLKINDIVLKAIGDAGMIYDSSYPIYFDTIPKESPKYSLVENFLKLYVMRYNAPKMSKIDLIQEIPVALPDDEILVDRLNFGPKQVSKCWIDSIKMSMKTEGGIFVLQIHPERISLLKESLIGAIDWAVKNNIHIKSLADIASSGTRPGSHYMAITGDIDIVKLSDIAWG